MEAKKIDLDSMPREITDLIAVPRKPFELSRTLTQKTLIVPININWKFTHMNTCIMIGRLGII